MYSVSFLQVCTLPESRLWGYREADESLWKTEVGRPASTKRGCGTRSCSSRFPGTNELPLMWERWHKSPVCVTEASCMATSGSAWSAKAVRPCAHLPGLQHHGAQLSPGLLPAALKHRLYFSKSPCSRWHRPRWTCLGPHWTGSEFGSQAAFLFSPWHGLAALSLGLRGILKNRAKSWLPGSVSPALSTWKGSGLSFFPSFFSCNMGGCWTHWSGINEMEGVGDRVTGKILSLLFCLKKEIIGNHLCRGKMTWLILKGIPLANLQGGPEGSPLDVHSRIPSRTWPEFTCLCSRVQKSIFHFQYHVIKDGAFLAELTLVLGWLVGGTQAVRCWGHSTALWRCLYGGSPAFSPSDGWWGGEECQPSWESFSLWTPQPHWKLACILTTR